MVHDETKKKKSVRLSDGWIASDIEIDKPEPLSKYKRSHRIWAPNSEYSHTDLSALDKK